MLQKNQLLGEEIPLADAFAILGPSQPLDQNSKLITENTSPQFSILDYYPPIALGFINELNLVYYLLSSLTFASRMGLKK